MMKFQLLSLLIVFLCSCGDDHGYNHPVHKNTPSPIDIHGMGDMGDVVHDSDHLVIIKTKWGITGNDILHYKAFLTCDYDDSRSDNSIIHHYSVVANMVSFKPMVSLPKVIKYFESHCEDRPTYGTK